MLGSFSSSGNSSGGFVSSPDPSIDAFSDVFVDAVVVVASSFEIVSFDVNAGVISISSDDNGISAAPDKSTVNRMANVVFYQLVDVIRLDKQ